MKYLNYAQRLLTQAMEIVWILIDYSPSMESDDYKPSRIEGAIKANTKLIETKAGLYPQDMMGVDTVGIKFKGCCAAGNSSIQISHISQCQSICGVS